MEKITLIIEREKSNDTLWGRINYHNNLIVNTADTIKELQNKLLITLKNFHDLDPDQVEFDIVFDLTTLFGEKDFLNLSAVAERLGLNRSLLAQYVAGIKYPSLERALQIEQVIHGFGNELIAVKLAVGGKLVSEENYKKIV